MATVTKKEIRLKIREEADMFTPCDPDQKLLSEDVGDYLIRCYKNEHRKSAEDYVIHIFSDTPVNEERVKQAVRGHCEQERDNIRHEMKLETLKEVSLGLLGVGFLLLWFFLSSSMDGVLPEVISIMGWVAVWEATSIAIMQRPELYRLKKTYEQASKAQIVIDVTEGAETEA